jgi:site-specific recombinase XerD
LSGQIRRQQLDESILQKAVKQALKAAGTSKGGSCHTLRHSLATQLLEAGYDVRTMRKLRGHKAVTTTMIYTHLLNQGARGELIRAIAARDMNRSERSISDEEETPEVPK